MQIKYINLESCPDKNSRMQEMLARHRLSNVSGRFPGIVSTKRLNGMSLSETGCLLAHHSLLMSLDSSESTLILEDDVSLCIDFGEKIKILIGKLESSEVDIFLLGQTIPYQSISKHAKLLKLLGHYKETGSRSLLDANSFYSYGTFAYVVNRKSTQKIKELFHRLDFSGSAKPIDELLSDWFQQGILKGRIIFPYLAGVESDLESTMFDRSANHDHALHAGLVNLYLEGHTPNVFNSWEKIISESPNLHALEICKSIYLRLNRD